MQQPSLRTPLSVLALGLFMIALLLARPAEQQVAHSQGYSAPATATAVPTTAVPQPTAVATVSSAATRTTATPATPTQTQLVPTAQVFPTAQPFPTNPPVQPTEEPIVPPLELSSRSNAVTCSAGVPVEIRGVSAPRAALLIYFGQRAVGGGSARSDGSFSLTLNVGDERAGSYDVRVLVRGSWEEVASMTCVVPYLTPTPRIVN